MGKLVIGGMRTRRRLADLSQGATTLHDAINSLSPLSHWPMRDTSGSALDDIGSLNNDSASAESTALNGATAPDGFPCPNFSGSGNAGGSAPDQAGYSPAAASGLTVCFAIRPDTLPAAVAGICAKRDDAGTTAAEWVIRYDSSGKLDVRTLTLAAGTARSVITNAAAFAVNTWAFAIAQFQSGATSNPSVRVNGSAVAQTTGGSGTAASDNASKLQIARQFSGNTRHDGQMAHLAIFAGVLSVGDCQILEAAADSDGFY